MIQPSHFQSKPSQFNFKQSQFQAKPSFFNFRHNQAKLLKFKQKPNQAELIKLISFGCV
jgi:hypothetical protein